MPMLSNAEITAGFCGGRNGTQRSFCGAGSRATARASRQCGWCVPQFERCVGRKLAAKRIDMRTPGENHGLSHRLHFQRCDPVALGASRPTDYWKIIRPGKDSERPKDVRRD